MSWTWVLVALVILWIVQLPVLWRMAESRGADPVRIVSGAATFFIFAIPATILAPGLVDRVADFWEWLTGPLIRALGGSGRHRPISTPAYLLIQGEQRPVDLPRLRIGRFPNNEVVLDHSTVSAYHAEIVERPDGRHEIIDRESRNGTRVNGALVRSQVLRDGDLVTLGATSMHYMSASPTSPQAVSGRGYRGPQRDEEEYWDDEEG